MTGANTYEFKLALKELKAAIVFFDDVNNSSEDEKIAVGRDHWDRLEAAARKVVSFDEIVDRDMEFEKEISGEWDI